MGRYKGKVKKVAIFTYLIIIIICFLAGTAFSYVYRKLPVMQIRYEAATGQAEEGTVSGEEQSKKDGVNRDVMEDFVFEKVYKPVRGMVNGWKTHVRGSLQAEHRRVIDERMR
ncbi:MAG: hypothetical protein Q8O30_03640 [Candidatus Omnitrophota bacterium]|nr:hypothetical protein [Candidatus Omnitrophota bacterium]